MDKGNLGRGSCKCKGMETPNSMGLWENCTELGFLELRMFERHEGRREWRRKQIMKGVYVYYGEYASSHSEVVGSGEECLGRTGGTVELKGWDSGKGSQGAE